MAQGLRPGPVSGSQSPLGSEDPSSRVEPAPSPGPLPDLAASDAAKMGYNGI